jgi:hypothetical protein
MKYLIIACLIMSFPRSVFSQNHENTYDSIVALDTSDNTDLLITAKYYYDKYFDRVVAHSLENGFIIYDQFDAENSYSIMKATHWLAKYGDTIVQLQMFDLLYKLAYSNRPYKVDESIFALVEFYIGLSDKRLFEICLEFMNPIHSFVMNRDCNEGDYTSLLFGKLVKTVTQADQEFYGSKFMNLYTTALDKNGQNVSINVWKEFYPFLKQEFEANRIEFIMN